MSGADLARDLTCAWSCATSYLMCHDMSHPPTRNHQVALLDLHAYELLIYTEADPDRVAALAVRCHQRARIARRWRGGAAIAYHRMGRPGNGRWRFALSALTPTSRHTIASYWAAAGDLVAAALRLIRAADADTNPFSRHRLLSDAEHIVQEIDWGAYLPDTTAGLGPVRDAAAR